MFDTFVIVDWSAAGTPKTGRDSIWICAVDRDGSERLIENPRTRHGAKILLGELLSDATARNERVLLGFDFPFGYPAGFAQRLGLAATPPWRAVWDEIAARLTDGANNQNDRFKVRKPVKIQYASPKDVAVAMKEIVLQHAEAFERLAKS